MKKKNKKKLNLSLRGFPMALGRRNNLGQCSMDAGLLHCACNDNKNIKKKIIFSIVILFILVSFLHPALAQYQNQEKIPGAATQTSDFVQYVKDIINFGFAILSILALFMLIIGAYQYLMAAGNIGKAEDAKSTIASAILGLILGLTAYIILYKINPDLVNMRGISQITGAGAPSKPTYGTSGGSGAGIGSGQCEPVASGPCSQENLANTCFGSNAYQASSICNAESGGGSGRLSGVDITQDGYPFSVGLFQINLTVHSIGDLNCPSAFSGRNKKATVINHELYQKCVQAAQNPNTNIEKACQIGNNGSSWKAWGANKKCGF